MKKGHSWSPAECQIVALPRRSQRICRNKWSIQRKRACLPCRVIHWYSSRTQLSKLLPFSFYRPVFSTRHAWQPEIAVTIYHWHRLDKTTALGTPQYLLFHIRFIKGLYNPTHRPQASFSYSSGLIHLKWWSKPLEFSISASPKWNKNHAVARGE